MVFVLNITVLVVGHYFLVKAQRRATALTLGAQAREQLPQVVPVSWKGWKGGLISKANWAKESAVEDPVALFQRDVYCQRQSHTILKSWKSFFKDPLNPCRSHCGGVAFSSDSLLPIPSLFLD
jgi:hypothetical protein